MQRGTVDAGLMTSYSLETYKMWEVCDQVVNPPIFNHCFVGAWMNLDKWKSLSPELQRILIDSARKLETHWISYCEMDDARIEKLISRLRQKIEMDPSNPRYLVTVRGRGYRLLSRPSD